MKIAVASENEMVTAHFGYCTNFHLYDTEDSKIIHQTTIPNPGHKPGFLPNYLNDLMVNVIISGGIGNGAVEIFNKKGIEVVIGASGLAVDAVNSYLHGLLKTTGAVCHEHDHHEDCVK